MGASGAVANFFDLTGRFRSRTASVKRPRPNEDPDSVFDFSRDYPPLVMPPHPAVDLSTVKSLLVESSKLVEKVRELENDKDYDPKIRFLATAWTNLFVLVEAVIEKAIDPMANGQSGGPPRTGRPPPPASPS